MYFIILSFLLIAAQSQAATYYVDNIQGNDNNTGLSEVSPWQSVAKVNSSSFLPGDEILFKRNGQWFEILIVSSSGTDGAPIRFADYGQGERPVIDGENLRTNSILIHSKSYVIIENFNVKNTTGDGVIRVMWSSYIEVLGNYVFATAKGGIFIETSSNCVIGKNNIATPTGEYDHQTDGIYSQRNTSNIYEKNKIVISNAHPLQHVDGIQSFIDENLIIRDNYIVQNSYKTNSQGIYSTSGSGIHTYYNNVVDCPNTVSAVVGFHTLISNTEFQLIHNTLIGKGANIIDISATPVHTIKNNVFLALSSNYSIINVEDLSIEASIDYNIYYNSGNPYVIVFRGNRLTLEQWRELGYDLHSFIAEPGLESDYTLTGSSPAIDKGIEMGGLFIYDKAGTQRPQLNGVDIGAYEKNFEVGENDHKVPLSFQLYQNYPNPFNPNTVISFQLYEAADVKLEIFTISGALLHTLIEDYLSSGDYRFQFDASDLASGIYIYSIQIPGRYISRKMVLLK